MPEKNPSYCIVRGLNSEKVKGWELQYKNNKVEKQYSGTTTNEMK